MKLRIGRIVWLAAQVAVVVLVLLVVGVSPARARVVKLPGDITFRVPAGWRVKGQGGLFALIPRNMKKTPTGQPAELYVLGAQSVAGKGLTRVDDPRVIQVLDLQVRKQLWFLQRVGGAQKVRLPKGRGAVGDMGIRLNYAGRNGAIVVRARVYAALAGNYGVMLLAIGRKGRVAARQRVLKRLFRSLRCKSGVGAGSLGGVAWGFTVRPPKGWIAASRAGWAMFGHKRIAGAIIVKPHTERSRAAVRRVMLKGVRTNSVRLQRVGRLKRLGRRGYVGDYRGVVHGTAISARVVGTYSPHGGGGAWVFAFTTTAKFGAPLQGAATATARRIRYLKTRVTGLMRRFAGKWGTVSRNTATKMVLHRSGRYYSQYSSSYSGKFHNRYGDWIGHWGVARDNNRVGRWTVRGNRRRGQLIIHYANGRVHRSAYRVHTERGRTYWREYYFGNQLYRKQ